MKQKPTKRVPLSDSAVQAIRENDRATGGKGVEVSIGLGDNIIACFSNKLPPLEINIAQAKKSLGVEISSVEQENTQLLHFLFRKTVEQ